jgi:hypothetical protein
MKLQTKSLLASSAAALVAALATGPVLAGTIANWKVFAADQNAGNTPATSNMNTDSPTIGDGTNGDILDDADGAYVGGRFGTVGTPLSVTLAVGETLTVSGSVTLSGGVGTNLSELRFGVFNAGTDFNSSSTWSDGGFVVRADNGWWNARTNGAFVSTGGDAANITNLSEANETSGTIDYDSPTAAYDWSLSVTRDSLGTVDLSASIAGGDGSFSGTYSVNDVTTDKFTFDALGILFGNQINLAQGDFSGVQYNVVPEPGSLALLGLGGLLVARRRRRA